MVRPADGIAKSARPVASRVVAEGFGDLQEPVARSPADLFHHLRRVALEMALQNLEDAHRVLQRKIVTPRARHRGALRVRLAGVSGTLSRGRLIERVFVHPRIEVVFGVLFSPARKKPVQVLCIAEVVVDDGRRVGVVEDVLPEVPFILDDVANQSAEERDIGAGAKCGVNVRDRAGACEPRIHVDDHGAALFCLHHPLKAYRVILRHVRTLNHNAVRVLQILLERGCAASSKAGPQTGDRGGVSNTGLVFYLNNAQRSEQFLDEIVLFVVERGAAQVRHR